MADKTTALIYIGQTPRNDITPEMRQYLEGHCEITEIGVLDGLTKDEVNCMKPREDGHSLITKLSSGEAVTVDEDIIRKRMADTIREASAAGYDSCAVMCTGSFPDIPDNIPVITSDNAFHKDVVIDSDICTIGLLVPMEDQQKPFTELYRQTGRRVVTDFASPYGPLEKIINAAVRLKDMGAECIFLDCMGFSGSISDAVSKATGLKCFIPRKEIARQIISLYN